MAYKIQKMLATAAIDEKKVWKDFTKITTNRPSKSDIKTLQFVVVSKGVVVDWGDYKHLGSCLFSLKYFQNMGCTQDEFVTWLKSIGLSQRKKLK